MNNNSNNRIVLLLINICWFSFLTESIFSLQLQHYQSNQQHQHQQHQQSASTSKNPSILIEGCIDDGCLQTLTKNFRLVSKCFESLHEQLLIDDSDYSIKLCCNIIKYERCIFPYIIFLCGMNSLDKFEMELRSLNSLCSLTTLQWHKCEPIPQNSTLDDNLENELRES